MEKSIFKERGYTLAIKESDLSFRFSSNGYLRSISVSSNKVIELRKNRLLEPHKLQNYNTLAIVHDKKILTLPIIKNSWKYGGQKNCLLSFDIPKHVRLKKEDLYNWHLRVLN